MAGFELVAVGFREVVAGALDFDERDGRLSAFHAIQSRLNGEGRE